MKTDLDKISLGFTITGVSIVAVFFIVLPYIEPLYGFRRTSANAQIVLWLIHGAFGAGIFTGAGYLILKKQGTVKNNKTYAASSIFLGLSWFGLICMASFVGYNRTRLIAQQHLYAMGDALYEFSNQHEGLLCDSECWCDSILEGLRKFDKDAPERIFSEPGPREYKCNYAFNEHLSGAVFSDVPGNVIVLFESSGEWNLHGDEQLFNRYLPTYQHWFIRDYSYVLLADLSIAKYYSGNNTFEKVPQLWKHYKTLEDKKNTEAIRWRP